MANELIDQHKRMAMGEPAPQGECSTPFKGEALHGGEELSKKMHLKDGKRGMKHLNRVADHGEHGMNTPRDGQTDNF